MPVRKDQQWQQLTPSSSAVWPRSPPDRALEATSDMPLTAQMLNYWLSSPTRRQMMKDTRVQPRIVHFLCLSKCDLKSAPNRRKIQPVSDLKAIQ